jgi:hypothetical protein
VLAAGGFAFNIVSARLFPEAWGELAEALTDGRQRLVASAAVRMAIGYAIVWLYAAARFRLRSTLKTAARIGIAAWFMIYVPTLYALFVMGLVDRVPLAFLAAWGLAETLVAAVAGGFVHQSKRPPGRY